VKEVVGYIAQQHVSSLSGTEAVDHIQPLGQNDTLWRGLIQWQTDDDKF
jgi:hypothetical protein